MKSEERTEALLHRAESSIATAEREFDEKRLYHLTGELQAVNEILENIVKSSHECL
jgi:hypothetical protein